MRGDLREQDKDKNLKKLEERRQLCYSILQAAIAKAYRHGDVQDSYAPTIADSRRAAIQSLSDSIFSHASTYKVKARKSSAKSGPGIGELKLEIPYSVMRFIEGQKDQTIINEAIAVVIQRVEGSQVGLGSNLTRFTLDKSYKIDLHDDSQERVDRKLKRALAANSMKVVGRECAKSFLKKHDPYIIEFSRFAEAEIDSQKAPIWALIEDIFDFSLEFNHRHGASGIFEDRTSLKMTIGARALERISQQSQDSINEMFARIISKAEFDHPGARLTRVTFNTQTQSRPTTVTEEDSIRMVRIALIENKMELRLAKDSSFLHTSRDNCMYIEFDRARPSSEIARPAGESMHGKRSTQSRLG